MLIYAHRAGRGLAAENTLFACQIALQYPIDYIDFDIGMTQDGEIVVTHDLELNPDITQDSSGKFIFQPLPIASITYEELSQYNVGQINPLSSYYTYFPQQQRIAFAPIPRLQEIISFVRLRNPHMKFQIEMKSNPHQPHLTPTPETFGEALIHLLEENDIVDITEVQSFDYNCLLSLKKQQPRIKTTFLTPPDSDQDSTYTLWTAGYCITEFNDSIATMIHALGGSCWGPYQMEITQKQLEEAKKLGLKVVPWGFPEKEGTEFNAPQIARLKKWGVDGIICDRPDKALKLLRGI